jgi:hypothetical protein
VSVRLDYPVFCVPPQILAPKGIKQWDSMTSAKRGQNITIIVINAVGDHLRTMFILPRCILKSLCLKVHQLAKPSGWYNELLFMEFFSYLI